MDVVDWRTPTRFFPWPRVRRFIDAIDAQVYRLAIEFAQEEFLDRAHPCPSCGREPASLFWSSISDPAEAWEASTGRVGFLTICQRCQLQVDFLVDEELTEMQADQWREYHTLAFDED